tara:strand:+ start:1089 stop:1268 length:180 start_codon:yes stop_codon:yes gene_type:complete
MSMVKQLNIRIDDDLLERLRELADENYSTVSQVARFAIGRYLDLLRQAEDEDDGEGGGT